jgi:hypothetical protein
MGFPEGDRPRYIPMKVTGNIKVLFDNFNNLTVNPRNAMLSQQIHLM